MIAILPIISTDQYQQNDVFVCGMPTSFQPCFSNPVLALQGGLSFLAYFVKKLLIKLVKV